jgi:hypothetical protein
MELHFDGGPAINVLGNDALCAQLKTRIGTTSGLAALVGEGANPLL